jgi:hypothetical protein
MDLSDAYVFSLDLIFSGVETENEKLRAYCFVQVPFNINVLYARQ